MLPTGTVTFLFTDIEGSAKLAQQYPDAMPALLARHHAMLNEAIVAHGGQVFQIIGDAFCVAFHSARDAVAASVEAQRGLLRAERRPLTESAVEVRVRMGIHAGEATVRADGQYDGYLTLTRAQRVMSVAHGGQVLLSQTTVDLVRDALPSGVTVRDMGEHRLKGIANPERLWQLVAPDLRQDFPPLASLDALPNNLPVQLTSFVGREKEIKEIKRLLATTRLLTFTGSGGVGKTRLSLQVGADLLDSFANGVWFVELAPLADPALVPQSVALVFGLEEESSRPFIEILKDYLREKSMLLLLDNCEHLTSACAELADTLLHAAPQLKILASSREALGIAGELAWHVPSLTVPDVKHLPPLEQLAQYEAVKLFVERAVFASSKFTVIDANALAVAQVCHRLDGIPLAIELAAARVKTLKVEQIATRLDDRFRLLTGGSRTALPRQQTLRAMIDWSYDLLPEPERVLLRRLSVFAGGCTLDAAEDVCGGNGIEKQDVLDLLTRLFDKSLVVFDESGEEARYRLLETIRQYARDKLLESGEGEMIRTGHLRYFLKLAEDAGPQLYRSEQLQWLNRLDSEFDNMRVALEWSLGSGSIETGLRIVGALWPFCSVRGYWSETLEKGEALLAQPAATQMPAARANALRTVGNLHFHLGDNSAWRAPIEQCISLCREMGSEGKQLLARSLSNLAFCLGQRGLGPAAANSLAEESLTISREIEDKYGISNTLLNLGLSAFLRGDYASGINLFEESIAVSREMGNRIGCADVLGHLARALIQQGYYAAARSRCEEALAIAREMSFKRNIAANLNILGHIELLEGNSERAKELYESSLSTGRELGYKYTISVSLTGLGKIAQLEGAYERAQALQRESLSLRRESGDKFRIADSLAAIASLAAARGNPMRVAKLLGAIEELFVTMGARMPPVARVEYGKNAATARAQLGEATFNAAWAEGRAMTLEQAIEYALEADSG